MKINKYLYFFSFFLVILGLIIQPNVTLLSDIKNIIVGPDGLIRDAFLSGSMGAALVNAGLCGILCTALFSFTKTDISGTQFPAVMQVIGFAFFGKNILNILPILLGGYIYSRFNDIKLEKVWASTMYSTALAPLLSEVMFVIDMPLYLKIMLTLTIGISIGYLIHLVAPVVYKVHNGMTLYNTGLTLGFMGTAYVSLFRLFKVDFTTPQLWETEQNLTLFLIFLTFYTIVLAYSYYKERDSKKLVELIKIKGVGHDYYELFGFYTFLKNVSLVSLVGLMMVWIIHIPFNGAILGAVICISGFASFGKNPLTIIPPMIGSLLATLLRQEALITPGYILAMFYITTLAPIVNNYGIIYGIIAGLFSGAIVSNTAILHGGMSLYNTGFASGIAVIVLIPLFDNFKQIKDRFTLRNKQKKKKTNFNL